MKIITFAWTSDALLAGRKTCTSRDWSAAHARRFKAGDLVAAWDKSPRFGGRQIATIRLTHDATFGTLEELVPNAYECEGFAFYDEQVASGDEHAIRQVKRGLNLPNNMTLREYLDMSYGSLHRWIIRFELESLANR